MCPDPAPPPPPTRGTFRFDKYRLVMEELRALDGIAYVRFASVYHSFKDLSQFLDVLQEMQPASPAPKPRRGKPTA